LRQRFFRNHHGGSAIQTTAAAVGSAMIADHEKDPDNTAIIIAKLEGALTDLIDIDANCGGAFDLQSVIDQLENIIRKLNSPL
jgi:hypothetical protein